LKYAPTFPERFGCLADAQDSWAISSSGTTMNTGTPASACTARPTSTTAWQQPNATDRFATLAVARAANPERFTSSTPPKILHLPDAAWINPPLPAEPAA
jgi:putative transposase